MKLLRSWLPMACVLPALWASLTGCSGKPPEKPDTSPPVVAVSKPIERDITDYVDYTGRTEAKFSTDIRARVTGYLVKMPFVEGDEVKEGNLLFRVDPVSYTHLTLPTILRV